MSKLFAYPAEIPDIDKFRGALSFAMTVTVNLVAFIAGASGEVTSLVNVVLGAWLVVLFMVWRP
jgi:hypothetical protein